MKMGIDPVTHKPVSQVLSDLGSISSLTSTTTQSQMNYVNNNSILEHTKEEQIQYSLENEQVQYDQFTNQESFQQNMLSEVASSSSSSCSSNLTRLSSPISLAQINSNFDWSEFLQNDDPFVWQEIQNIQQCDIKRVMSSLSISGGLMKNEGEISNNNNNNNNFNGNGNDKQGGSSEGFDAVTCVASKDYQVNNKQCEGKSFSGYSFVDGILDKDKEIRAAFPELLDDSFDY
jgi:myb proto-oncogene protein